ETPKAEDSIENLKDLPAGTTVSFKDPVDTSTEGEKNATVVVTYPDGSSETVSVKIVVKDKRTDADKNDPKAKDQTVGLNETPKAEDSIENLKDLPAGTTVSFKDPVDTSTEGEKNATVVVTYPDGSSEEVPVKIVVKNADKTADKPTIIANEDGSVTVKPGADNVKESITYTDEAGNNHTITITKGENGNWTAAGALPEGVTISKDGALTIPADKVKDGSTVTATGTDNQGNTETATGTAGHAKHHEVSKNPPVVEKPTLVIPRPVPAPDLGTPKPGKQGQPSTELAGKQEKPSTESMSQKSPTPVKMASDKTADKSMESSATTAALPKTGTEASNVGVYGLAALGLAGFLALGKRKREDEE
ncbi:Rib/alpha-like domain-containing protein, partial [Streptococcus marmotae]